MPRGHAFLLLTQRVKKGAFWVGGGLEEGTGKARSPLAGSETWERCSARRRRGPRGRRWAEQPPELKATCTRPNQLPWKAREAGSGSGSGAAHTPPPGGRKSCSRSGAGPRHLSEVLKVPAGGSCPPPPAREAASSPGPARPPLSGGIARAPASTPAGRAPAPRTPGRRRRRRRGPGAAARLSPSSCGRGSGSAASCRTPPSPSAPAGPAPRCL